MAKIIQPFSDRIENWLKGDQPKTFDGLQTVFGVDKGLAIFVMLLMFLPALPLPTGGITHIFEIITMIIAAQMIIGVKKIWLPKRWRHKPLGDGISKKALPFIVRRIRWFEKWSRPRLSGTMKSRLMLRFIGFIILILVIGAFSAPPFSGLDTLPALGAVIVAMSLILEDIVVFIFGCLVGVGGIILSLTVGVTLVEAIKHFF
ncbi:MAG TPA: exopolysaccharide biosynthesis protein [Candidatus Saccharimonadales bacterium]|nr:exopolysaccharide biosynthesis protein [Candidatus Saccharimonadales bacterium]